MEILIPEGSGFCPGVVSAEKKLFKIRNNNKGIIYLSGMFIHNKEYEKFLKENNIIEINNLKSENNSSILVISTHGIDRDLENIYSKRYKVYDLTCPKVKNVQKIIWENKDFFVIITGKNEHPETKGLKSYAKEYMIISDLNQLDDKSLLDKIKNKKILLISQTTANYQLFENVCLFFKQKFIEKYIKELITHNTICPSIEKREKNSIDLLKKYDIKAIVIGDFLSSNSRRLFDKLSKIKKDIYFIEKKEDIYKFIDNIRNEKRIMVVSSSSTPSFIEKEITDFLQNL